MTVKPRRRPTLAEQVSACCKANLYVRPDRQVACSECGMVAPKRLSRRFVEEQRGYAVLTLMAKSPELIFTKEQRDALWKRMTESAYD